MTTGAPSGIGPCPSFGIGLPRVSPPAPGEMMDYNRIGELAGKGMPKFSPTIESKISSVDVSLGDGIKMDLGTLVDTLTAGIPNMPSPSKDSNLRPSGMDFNINTIDNLVKNLPTFSPTVMSRIGPSPMQEHLDSLTAGGMRKEMETPYRGFTESVGALNSPATTYGTFNVGNMSTPLTIPKMEPPPLLSGLSLNCLFGEFNTKPEPVDYTSPVSNIMNRIGMPELDLKPKSYLPPSLGHLPGMNHVPEPDTSFQLYGLSGTSPLMAMKEAKRMLAGWETKKMLEEMEKPLAFLQLGINSLPEPEPDTPSGFIPYQDPTQIMLDMMKKTRHGSIFGLDSEPKSYLSSLKNQLSMHLMPEPEPDDTPSVMDIMKVTVPKFDFSGYMNTVPELEPVIPVRPVLSFMEDAKPSVQEILDYVQSPIRKISSDIIEDLKPKQITRLYALQEPIDTNSFESLGNYINDIGLTDIKGGMGIRERFDFGGHSKGTKGPHVQYDMMMEGVKLRGNFPVLEPKDYRPLGQGKTDFVSFGENQSGFGYHIEGKGRNRRIKIHNKED